MSEQSSFAFGKLIPGFDFLQQLTAGGQGSASGVPGLQHWIAPTVNLEELEQRVTELKAVQFWLEQNLLALKATIQALEVQKMTLATLRGMNLSMNEVAKAFAVPKDDDARPAAARWPYRGGAAAPATAAAPPAEPAAASDPEQPAPPASRRARPAASKGKAPASEAGATDPMQWWGALTQQFQQIAMQTMRDAARSVTDAGHDHASVVAAPASTTGKPAGQKKAAPAKKAVARKKPGRKAAAPKATAPDPARASNANWPLPTPFKLGKR